MKAFIVHAHPEPGSFCGALTRTARETLEAAGHEVEVSDLYAMGFGAVAGAWDFSERSDADFFRLAAEQEAAGAARRLPVEIAAEQERLRWCDLLILQFPLWWFSVPAILKGWLDRVLTRGFAWTPERCFGNGGLAGRRALLCFTTGAAEPEYTEDGSHGSLAAMLHPLHHGVLGYVGFEVLEPFPVFAAARIGEARRRRELAAWRRRLEAIEPGPPMAYPPDPGRESEEAGDRLP